MELNITILILSVKKLKLREEKDLYFKKHNQPKVAFLKIKPWLISIHYTLAQFLLNILSTQYKFNHTCLF